MRGRAGTRKALCPEPDPGPLPVAGPAGSADLANDLQVALTEVIGNFKQQRQSGDIPGMVKCLAEMEFQVEAAYLHAQESLKIVQLQTELKQPPFGDVTRR